MDVREFQKIIVGMKSIAIGMEVNAPLMVGMQVAVQILMVVKI
jgi:hypothetical protein